MNEVATRGAWQVRQVLLSSDAKKFGVERVQYPYHVVGVNIWDGGREFAWGVQNVNNPNYDFVDCVKDERNANGVYRCRINAMRDAREHVVMIASARVVARITGKSGRHDAN